MIGEKELKAELEKIILSNSMKKSPASVTLLKFLVQCTIDNVDVKESVIGLHLVGNKYNSEKSNARIRVSVYHLRKKLEQYYKEEGAGAPWRLHIEKGQYGVSVVYTSKETLKPIVGVSGYKNLLIISLLMVLGVVVFKPYLNRVPRLWKGFFNNSKNTTLYVGDAFGYSAVTTTGHWGWQRDYSINSLKELYQLLDTTEIDKSKIKPASYAYITMMGVDAAVHFTRYFSQYNQTFGVRKASDATVSDIKDENVIYAGPIKTNNLFIQLFVADNQSFSYKNNTLYYNRDKHVEFISDAQTREYAVVSRSKRTADTEQWFFFSDHDIGVKAVVEYFTNNDSVQHFTDQHLNGKECFTAIFNVKGIDRENMGMELLLVDQ